MKCISKAKCHTLKPSIKTMSKHIVWIGLFGFFWVKGFAQPSNIVSLDTLLHRISVHYPAIQQYKQNELLWQAKAAGSVSWMAPTFSTGLMRFPYNLSMVGERNDPMNQAGVAFSMEQMIPNRTKLYAKRDYFHSLGEIEKLKSNWTLNELFRDAKILYYSRFVYQEKQKAVAESEAVLTLLLTTAEARYSSNQSQLQTLYKARARLAELNNMKFMLSGFIAESNIGMNTLMVIETTAPFEIDSLVQPRNYGAGLVDSALLNHRSDIAALSHSIQSMRLEQKVMKVSAKPDFGFRAEHMQMFGMPNQWSVMGMVTIPLVPWSAKMYSSEVNSIGFQIQAMESERKTMLLMANRMVLEKLTMLNFENGQYQNYKLKIVPAYENNLEAGLISFRQNTGDLFVLLDAWEMLLMKKMEMLDRLFNILKLEAEYEYEMEIR